MSPMRIDGAGGVRDPKGPGEADRAKAKAGASPESVRREFQIAALKAADDVTISVVGRLLAQLSRSPDVRAERVEELRAMVADGGLEENSDVEEAIRGMLDDI